MPPYILPDSTSTLTGVRQLTWLNPVFDLVEVAGFEQGGVHHPPDLPGQPQHQLQAAGGEAEAGQDQDGTEDDQETQQLVLKPTHR